MMDLEQLPTNAKLLLCQIVVEAKNDQTWQDILNKFGQHPVLRNLDKIDIGELSIKPETVPELVKQIIAQTVSKHSPEPKTPGRRFRSTAKQSQESDLQSHGPALKELNSITSSSNPVDFHEPVARELLTRTINTLHKQRVQEIKQQLTNNKKQFAIHLKNIT